jgi:hypothetical protein
LKLSTLSLKNLKILYALNKGRSKLKTIVSSITTNILLTIFRPRRDNTNPLGTEIVGTRYRGRGVTNAMIKRYGKVGR